MTVGRATKSLGIVDLLKLRGFDTTRPAKLVRLSSPNCDLDDLIRRGWLDFWQATQIRPVFDRCERIVSFVGTERTKARLVGVYRVRKLDAREKPRPSGFPPELDTGEHFYNLEPETGYEDLANRVVIEWGKGTLAWVQKLSNKEVVEMLPKGQTRPPLRDYLEFTLTHSELTDLFRHEDANGDWRARLAAVAGVYLVLATTTGKQYVGSAYGAKGIWGRWADYAKNGHGGNKLLKELVAKDSAYPDAFSYSILQILPNSLTRTEVVKCEQLFKEKLGSLATGLNAN